MSVLPRSSSLIPERLVIDWTVCTSGIGDLLSRLIHLSCLSKSSITWTHQRVAEDHVDVPIAQLDFIIEVPDSERQQIELSKMYILLRQAKLGI